MKPATLLKEPGGAQDRFSLLPPGCQTRPRKSQLQRSTRPQGRAEVRTDHAQSPPKSVVADYPALFRVGVEATIGAVAREARSITVLTRDDGFFQSTLC